MGHYGLGEAVELIIELREEGIHALMINGLVSKKKMLLFNP